MKFFLNVTVAAAAAASVAGCGEYEYAGRPVAYAQGNLAYADPVQAEAPVAATVDARAGDPQDVFIGAPADEYSDTDPSALSDFRSTLDPYGNWVEDSTYGTVWVPSSNVVGANFTPYVTSGHWAYGEDYVWVSDYDWGWAPFHYGRWVYIDNRGWSWIAGRSYAGAWVSWRTGYDGWGYVGWAPMPPSWYWHGGLAMGLGVIPRASYTFCATGDLFAPAMGGRVIAGQQGAVVGSHTRPYTPASPTVGGPGRTAASPTVNGSAPLGQHHFGPPPTSLGLGAGQFSAPPAQDRGLLRAGQFAKPSTATVAGARAPAPFAPAGSSWTPSPANAAASGYSRTIGSPDYNGRAVTSSPTFRPSQSGPTQTYRPAATGSAPTVFSSPSYDGARSQAPQRIYSTAPSGYAPSYSPQVSAPTFRSSPPSYSPQVSAPTFRSSPPSYSPQVSAPAPVSHGSFGGGGRAFTGAGGRGGRR
jgi:hypothetical protein